MSAGEERKLVTVLFADLVGSTAYAGERDPERVRVQLQRFYDAMRAEIELTGGTVEKFAGDAVLAVYGAPAALEDHAERALHAGLAMQDRLHEVFGDELRMRVGVNSGEVVAGSPHEGSSFVTGDAVNVADRLQKAAEPGEVLAGERTVALAEGAFEFGSRRTVEAKGKADGLAAVPVLRALSATRPRGARSGRRAFVGREAELDVLRATYRRSVANEEAHLVTIVGEPGIGKSRLVLELERVLEDEGERPLWRTGSCLAYGDGITYWPVGEVLTQHYALREGDPPAEVAERLGNLEILGLALGLDVAEGLHPLDARERLHAAIVTFFEELARESPVVLVIEDVHWAEPDLLDLVERLVSEVRGTVLVVATARPELLDRRPTWGAGQRNAAALWLDPLTAKAAGSLLQAMLPATQPEELRALVVERAGGNPFFLEELVGELADSGLLADGGDGREPGEVDRELLPDTVHAVLAARIDRLPPTEKAALQAGAVVGRVFWEKPVVHLLDDARPDFALLEERDLVTAHRASLFTDDREFEIKHALTREVAYASISKAQRGRLHASLAEWLERSDVVKDERASLLAYHYSEAVKPEDADLVWAGDREALERLRARAVRWLSRAAELARSRYEMEEAVRLLTKATELTDDEHERALLWRAIGDAQALRYDGDAFWSAMQRALEGPLDDAEQADLFSQLAFQTSIRSGMWTTRPATERVEDWVGRALERAAPGSDAEARALLARAEIDPARVSAELVQSISAVADADAGTDSEIRSFALGALCHAAYEQRRFVEAAAWATTRLGLVDEIEDPDGLCEVYEDGVPIAATLGDMEEAHRLAELHFDIARRLSPHHRLHSVSLLLETAEAMGDWTRILELEPEVASAIAENLATPCIRNARDLFLCALAHLCTGGEGRSRELERQALELSGAGHERELAPVRLRTALVRGDDAGVRKLVQSPFLRTWVWGPGLFGTCLDALAALRERSRIEHEASSLAQEGTIAEPFALRALGIVRGDDDLVARADERFAALGLDWHRAQTHVLLEGL